MQQGDAMRVTRLGLALAVVLGIAVVARYVGARAGVERAAGATTSEAGK